MDDLNTTDGGVLLTKLEKARATGDLSDLADNDFSELADELASVLPTELSGLAGLMGSTLKCGKLQEEANAVKAIIEKLPPCPSHDNNDKWIPRSKRGYLFLRAEKLKEYYGKVDEMKQMAEKVRIDELVRKHEALHPPNTEECPLCLESIPITELKSVQYLVCCGNICCYKCMQLSVAGGKMKMKKCPMCRGNLLASESECVRLTRKCADAGRAWAQTQIGIYYLEGSSCEHGTVVSSYKVDKKEALRWFQLAADQKFPDAIRNIAQMQYGLVGVVKGVKQSHTKARALMKKAADLGNLRAQRNYAMMCRLGEGGPEDKAEAAHYYSLAYAQMDSDGVTFGHNNGFGGMPEEIVSAAFFLGEYYYRGYGGLKKDQFIAKTYLEEVAKKGGRHVNPKTYMYIAACLMELYNERFIFNSTGVGGDYNIPGYSPIPRALALYRTTIRNGGGNTSHTQATLAIHNQLEAHMKEKCANCGKEAKTVPDGKLKACIRCRATWYCGKECQTMHWKEGAGHKADCVKYGSTGVPKE